MTDDHDMWLRFSRQDEKLAQMGEAVAELRTSHMSMRTSLDDIKTTLTRLDQKQDESNRPQDMRGWWSLIFTGLSTLTVVMALAFAPLYKDSAMFNAYREEATQARLGYREHQGATVARQEALEKRIKRDEEQDEQAHGESRSHRQELEKRVSRLEGRLKTYEDNNGGN